jgi:hypothetical protein
MAVQVDHRPEPYHAAGSLAPFLPTMKVKSHFSTQSTNDCGVFSSACLLGTKIAYKNHGDGTMFMKFIPLADIAAPDSAATYGWESVALALLLALGLVGGLILTQVLYRWLIRHMTRSGSDADRSNGPQEC